MHKFNKAVFIIKTAEENRQTYLELYNINITAISKKKKSMIRNMHYII